MPVPVLSLRLSVRLLACVSAWVSAAVSVPPDQVKAGFDSLAKCRSPRSWSAKAIDPLIESKLDDPVVFGSSLNEPVAVVDVDMMVGV